MINTDRTRRQNVRQWTVFCRRPRNLWYQSKSTFPFCRTWPQIPVQFVWKETHISFSSKVLMGNESIFVPTPWVCWPFPVVWLPRTTVRKEFCLQPNKVLFKKSSFKSAILCHTGCVCAESQNLWPRSRPHQNIADLFSKGMRANYGLAFRSWRFNLKTKY